MKRRRIAVVLFLLSGFFSASFALADTTSAGIPEENIWLSKSAPVEGDSIRISLPVYNGGTAKITGDAVFSVDGTQVGVAHFDLEAGNSIIVSSPWTATRGTHTVTARLEGAIDAKTGTEIAVSANTQSLAITVSERPPTPAAVQALESVAAVAQSTASAAAPVVASVAGAVINKTEELRKAAVASLENSLAGTDFASSAETSPTGTVLGAATYRAPQLGSKAMAGAAAAPASSGVIRMLQHILLFIVSYTWIFYPLLLIVLLGLLYLVAKTVSRKKPRRA
jgi:hypothetical protein